ncbi:PH domain-containing protein [Candidatus Micrarchaeota archaeon]|nr:PH domain-containing protein [Candidatus Micrarchaeota archaeon]
MPQAIDEMKIRHLDKRIKVVWSLGALSVAFVLWLMLTIVLSLAFPEEFMGIDSEFYPFFCLAIVLIGLAPYMVWIELRFQNYTYYMGPTELIIRRGVLRIERVVMPFEKIQNVNVSRPILERALGLAIIKIETAGTNPNEAEGVIPGVANYKDVVDEILTCVAAVKASSHQTAPPKEEEKKSEEKLNMGALLTELESLRNEVKTLKDHVKTEKPEKPEKQEMLAPLLETEGERYKKSSEKELKPGKKGKKT